MIRRTILTALAVALVLPNAGLSQPAAAQSNCSVTGDLEIVPLRSKVFHNTRNLRIWLPPGYHDSANRRTKYPVLYLNDGQDIFDACTSTFSQSEWRADETATDLILKHRIPALIIVGIDNAGRRDRAREYLPYPDETLRPATPDVHGKDYPRFLLTEVMPLVNRTYRTDRNPARTGLGGSSYGAGISLYTVMVHPGTFGRLLLESPSLYAHDDYLLHRAAQFTAWPSLVYLGVGTVNEPKDDVDRLSTILSRSGLDSHRLCVRVVTGAAHNPQAWADRFPGAVLFLYGTASCPAR